MSRLPSPPSEEESTKPHPHPHPHSHSRPRPNEAVTVPLTSPIRTTPIHPRLPEIRVPGNERREAAGVLPLPSTHYHPVTCEPLNIQDIQPQLQNLRKEYPSMTAIVKAQEDTVKEIKQKMEEQERKREEIQKALDKKAKEWEVEYKILSKYQASKSSSASSDLAS